MNKTAWATGYGKTTSSKFNFEFLMILTKKLVDDVLFKFKGFVGSASDELRQVDTYILTNDRCRQKFWGKPNQNIQICAGETKDDKDTCQVCSSILDSIISSYMFKYLNLKG